MILDSSALVAIAQPGVSRRSKVRVGERYGRGRHPATARLTDEPLLFTGDDFARTDVRAAPY